MRINRTTLQLALAGTTLGAALLLSPRAFGHCDTMDGPVVKAAQVALEKKDVTPVLMWIKKADEAEIKAAFTKTLAVRVKGTEARELADQFFFETLVRVHRAGEGAPFTGLKRAGTEVEPAIKQADIALETGSVDKVVTLVTDEAGLGVRQRFAEAREKKAHAEQNVDTGREFVAAYVEYIHYVEGLHKAARGTSHHDQEGGGVPNKNGHPQPAPEHKD